MTQAERESVVSAAREVVAGRVPLLSGLAELSTDDAAAAAQNYRRLGAEGLMVFPSLAYRTDRRETAAWYKAVAAAANLPIMIYNNPLAYRVDVDVPTLEALAEVPEIVAVKEETGDVRRVTDLFNAFGDRFDIFCGVDDLIVESVALGVVGWVSGMTNAWPEQCVKIFNAARAGDSASVLPLYRLMTPAFHLDTDVKLVQYIKLAEHLVYGAPAGHAAAAAAARGGRTGPCHGGDRKDYRRPRAALTRSNVCVRVWTMGPLRSMRACVRPPAARFWFVSGADARQFAKIAGNRRGGFTPVFGCADAGLDRPALPSFASPAEPARAAVHRDGDVRGDRPWSA